MMRVLKVQLKSREETESTERWISYFSVCQLQIAQKCYQWRHLISNITSYV